MASELRRCGWMVCVVLATSACRAEARLFPRAAPRWTDIEPQGLSLTPEETANAGMTDGLDKLLLFPLADLWAMPRETEAANVNALDEVPNSSWFTNRLGAFALTPEDVARGSCEETAPQLADGDLSVLASKTDGTNAGLLIEDAAGQKYLLKFDGAKQAVRAAAAEVIVSRIWWAAGYFTPCNFIVDLDVDRFVIAANATVKDQLGNEHPMVPQDVDRLLTEAERRADGRLRAVASRILDGTPIGPFEYENVRSDDANDLIPHEHRRELRGMYWLAAWVSHIDFRHANTLDMLVQENGRRIVRHYLLDFSDSLGAFYAPHELLHRSGNAYAADFQQIAADLFTLGLLDRPWKRVAGSDAEVLGFFPLDADPTAWRGLYQEPATARRHYRDDAWMGRILARFSDDHVRALVAAARLEQPVYEEELLRTLLRRRDLILSHLLLRQAPLDRFRLARQPGLEQQHLCFEDLALLRGLTPARSTYYEVWLFGGDDQGEDLGWAHVKPDPGHPAWSCLPFPPSVRRPADFGASGTPLDDPLRYGVAKIFVHQEGELFPRSQIDLHFYDLGARRGLQLVGIERPEEPGARPID